MALNIQPDGITSDRTIHTALPATDARHLWEVSWLPGRRVSRDNAITAMVLADLASPGEMDAGHWLWPHVEGWASELGLTAPKALTHIANPPSWANADSSGALDDPEAAG
jgi:hypothetical protein